MSDFFTGKPLEVQDCNSVAVYTRHLVFNSMERLTAGDAMEPCKLYVYANFVKLVQAETTLWIPMSEILRMEVETRHEEAKS